MESMRNAMKRICESREEEKKIANPKSNQTQSQYPHTITPIQGQIGNEFNATENIPISAYESATNPKHHYIKDKMLYKFLK